MPIDFSAMPMHMVMPHAAATTCSATSFKDVCPSAFLPLRRVWDELNATFPSAMSGYLQNVGARDGFVDDPLYSLISERGVTGLAMEPDAKQFQALKKNMAPFSGMSLVNLPISPSNAGEVLAFPLKVQGRSMDIFKLDIDGCECHILEKLLALGESVWSHPKVIQIEINHLLPPPIAYRDMCARDAPGRSAVPYEGNLDVWGCSMQAAYDVVRPHGYRLLQYDWPDAVFIHSRFIGSFAHVPWLDPESMLAAYWNGRAWADEHYRRIRMHQTDRAWVQHMMHTSLSSATHPEWWLRTVLLDRWNSSWRKRPLWLEAGISGTGFSVRVECDDTSKATQLYRGYVPYVPLAFLKAGQHDQCSLNGGAGLKLTWQRGNAWPDNPLDNPGRDNQNRNTSSTGNGRVLRSVDLI